MIEHIGKYPDNLGVGAKISQLGPKSINSKNLINYTSKDTIKKIKNKQQTRRIYLPFIFRKYKTLQINRKKVMLKNRY